jgi:hypothetical protein
VEFNDLAALLAFALEIFDLHHRVSPDAQPDLPQS